ncbi:MAG: hypothetical protein U9R58_01680 [Chloroflexota bacterium]|nr:hypothetical protein [Chloroflexota bacterium]
MTILSVLDSFEATRWIGVLAQSPSSSEEHEKQEADLKLRGLWSRAVNYVRREKDETSKKENQNHEK